MTQELSWIINQSTPKVPVEVLRHFRRFLERENQAKALAETYGLEVITPLAAVALFGISQPAIREARAKKNVKTLFTMRVTDRDVHLITLKSAKAFWIRNYNEERKERLEKNLTEMRDNGFTVAWRNMIFSILHAHPLFSLESDP